LQQLEGASAKKKPRTGDGRKCQCCGSLGTGRDVHTHRELSLNLDGKCRKQVETFRNGGPIKERREQWIRALHGATSSELARQMLQSLGQPIPVYPVAAAKSPPLAPVGAKSSFEKGCMPFTAGPLEAGQCCMLCRKGIMLQQELARVPCMHGHFFHQRCLNKWLRKSSECPKCAQLKQPSTQEPLNLSLQQLPIMAQGLQQSAAYCLQLPWRAGLEMPSLCTPGVELEVCSQVNPSLETSCSKSGLEQPSCEISTPPLSASNSTPEAASTSTVFEAPFVLEESDASDLLEIIVDGFTTDCLFPQEIAEMTASTDMMYELCSGVCC